MTEVARMFNLTDDAKRQIAEMMHDSWIEESSTLWCFVCGVSLRGKPRWHLAFDTENPDGCASGYTCAKATCSRQGLVSLHRERKHW